MIAVVLIVLFVAACAAVRHLQGMDQSNLPLKRGKRMLLFWPVATAFGVAAAYFMGVPWWAWPLALIPVGWSSMGGRHNVFFIRGLFGIGHHPTAEALQGGLGALASLGLMGIVVSVF